MGIPEVAVLGDQQGIVRVDISGNRSTLRLRDYQYLVHVRGIDTIFMQPVDEPIGDMDVA